MDPNITKANLNVRVKELGNVFVKYVPREEILSEGYCTKVFHEIIFTHVGVNLRMIRNGEGMYS